MKELFWKILICFCLGLINSSHGQDKELSSSSTRDSKFIAALVSFPNDRCISNNEVGVCFSKKKCTRVGGKNIGTCAHGYGTCCKFTAQCTVDVDDITVTRNQTTLLTPTTVPKTCTFSFPRQPGICQLRLDFPMFNLNGADTRGRCLTDKMTIMGSVTLANPLEICGNLGVTNPNHMYLDYGNSNGPITVAITTTDARSIYEIRTTQIKCNSENRVPADCLQYFTELSGNISSFNFPNQQLNSEDYRVCIQKRTPGQRLQWRQCTATPTLGTPVAQEMCLIGDTSGDTADACAGKTGSPPTACFTDYVEIPGSTAGRYCVSPFPRTVTTADFYIHVHFDEREPPTIPPPIVMAPNPLPTTCQPSENPGYYFPVYNPDAMPMCEARPLSPFPDIANKGFCLFYTTVASGIQLGDDPPPRPPMNAP